MFECGIGFEALRELLFIRTDTRADEAMDTGEAELFHLVHGLVRGPSFIGHAVGSDGESGAVVAEAAVNEDFLALVVVDDFEEARERFVAWEGTTPWDGDVSHAECGCGGFFGLAGAATHVDDDRDFHFLKIFEALMAGLAAAVESGGDFSKVRDASHFRVAGNGAQSREVLLRHDRRGECDEDGENRKMVGPHSRLDADLARREETRNKR